MQMAQITLRKAAASCRAARDAGTAPICIGESSYRPSLASAGDGVACEPHI